MNTAQSQSNNNAVLICFGVWLVGLVWSGWAPYDRATWWMEVAPALLAAPVLWFTRRDLPLSKLVLFFITLHGLVLMLGGAYTYARVPLGFEIQHWLGLHRNPYDKIGHFMQGFVPALVCREILLTTVAVKGRKMAAFLSICVAMAISACYELVEWGAALAMGQGADEFLGTQGDPWDTQSDMFFALIGSMVAMLALTRLQDRFIQKSG